ncbi:MAG: hypothetical protein GC202_07550 [Alphaproteobacteria bacterium]|nr:hypothetical protein [Alphaproteobacteria bacterium]
METVLIILAIYAASAFVLGLLSRTLGALVDFMARIVAGAPAHAAPEPVRVAPPPPRYPPMHLPKVGGY